MSQVYNTIIDHGVSVPGHAREVEYGFNSIGERFLLLIMSIVQLSGEKGFDMQNTMHYATHNDDVSLAQEFQRHMYDLSCKN